jgi:hypothetical protein
MNRFRLLFAAILCTSAHASPITITVSLDTSALIGHPAGPFSLDFELTDGSGTDDGNNTVTLSDFQFGGGGAQGTATLVGGATGDLTSTVVLTDSSFLNEFTQASSPGSVLTFTMQFTTNVDAGGTPDEFSFQILDSSGAALPSQSISTLGFDSFIVIDINSATPSVESFATDSTMSPSAGGKPVDIAAPQVVPSAPVSGVPEPGNVGLTAAAIAALCASRSKAVMLLRRKTT